MLTDGVGSFDSLISDFPVINEDIVEWRLMLECRLDIKQCRCRSLSKGVTVNGISE